MCGNCDNGLIKMQDWHDYGSTKAMETTWELCPTLENEKCPNCEVDLELMCDMEHFLDSDECWACWSEQDECYTNETPPSNCDEYQVANRQVCPECGEDYTGVLNG